MAAGAWGAAYNNPWVRLRIPNRNVIIANNLIVNPDGYRTDVRLRGAAPAATAGLTCCLVMCVSCLCPFVLAACVHVRWVPKHKDPCVTTYKRVPCCCWANSACWLASGHTFLELWLARTCSADILQHPQPAAVLQHGRWQCTVQAMPWPAQHGAIGHRLDNQVNSAGCAAWLLSLRSRWLLGPLGTWNARLEACLCVLRSTARAYVCACAWGQPGSESYPIC